MGKLRKRLNELLAEIDSEVKGRPSAEPYLAYIDFRPEKFEIGSDETAGYGLSVYFPSKDMIVVGVSERTKLVLGTTERNQSKDRTLYYINSLKDRILHEEAHRVYSLLNRGMVADVEDIFYNSESWEEFYAMQNRLHGKGWFEIYSALGGKPGIGDGRRPKYGPGSGFGEGYEEEGTEDWDTPKAIMEIAKETADKNARKNHGRRS